MNAKEFELKKEIAKKSNIVAFARENNLSYQQAKIEFKKKENLYKKKFAY